MKKIKAVVFIYSFGVSRNWANAGEGGDHSCMPSLMWLLHSAGWRMQNNYHPASKTSTPYSPEHSIIPPLFGKGKLKLQVELKLIDFPIGKSTLYPDEFQFVTRVLHYQEGLGRQLCLCSVYLPDMLKVLGSIPRIKHKKYKGKKKNLSMW